MVDDFVKLEVLFPYQAFRRYSRFCEVFGEDPQALIPYLTDAHLQMCQGDDWAWMTHSPEYVKRLTEDIVGNSEIDPDETYRITLEKLKSLVEAPGSA